MEHLDHYAIALLRKVSTAAGFTASPVTQDNYYRVWTRDAIVCGIACILLEEKDLHLTFKKSLQTIWQNQHKTGYLPSNVSVQTNEAGYGGSTGRADNTCWGIIGACLYSLVTGDDDLIKSLEPQIEKAFHVLDAWEYNGKHLLYVPQSGDWADEYIHHGYILFDQLLRYWALVLAAGMLKKVAYLEKAALVKQAIENSFYYRSDDQYWYSPQLARMKEEGPKDIWWMGFNPSQLYTQFDLQANMLSLLLNIGTEAQQRGVIKWTQTLMKRDELMLPSFFPVITEESRLMDELQNNYAYRFRNEPYEFHNGGLWPVWNGWACAAVQPFDEGMHSSLLQRMETALAAEPASFNECMHGYTSVPCGVHECAWSAAGYIIAKNATLFNQIAAL